MDWNTKYQHIAFQKILDMARFYLAVKGMDKEVTRKHITVMPGQECMTTYKIFMLRCQEWRSKDNMGQLCRTHTVIKYLLEFLQKYLLKLPPVKEPEQ